MKFSPVALAALILPAAAHGQILYGVTATSLVTVNPTTGATATVGSLGLPGNVIAGTLAWNPTDQSLYGIAYQFSGLTATDQLFIRINPATGAATTITTFGSQVGGVVYDGLEYVDSLNSLVVARGPGGGNSGSTALATISTGGAVANVVTTALDNDLLAYDAGHGVLYSLDPNGAAQFQKVNLTTGAHTSLGAEPSATTGEMAYSTVSDRLYALDYTLGNNSLYAIDTQGGNSPATLESTVTLAGAQVQGIAFSSPVPEPSEWAAIAGGGLSVWALARRRRC
ncbi:MAG TPA: PEP-CTERM sorting domain-containing protein [Candidatus Limnocylindria bacterium]|nr:PEP-CTERM sorting domain-containing protein [Candidatus Limnocylindria bacterium]